MGLGNIVGFWCGRDYWEMDSIFRECNLYGDKWDEKGKNWRYGEERLLKGINEGKNIYSRKEERDENGLRYALSKVFD
ncbi:phage NrS-1 polymerase family protein, partial [Staphylococcus epidermidis]